MIIIFKTFEISHAINLLLVLSSKRAVDILTKLAICISYFIDSY